MADVPLLVMSENAVSERRITPSWTITQLRARLEPITGIPPSFQVLHLLPPNSSGNSGRGQKLAITAADEDTVQLAQFPLAPYAELHVGDTRPPGARPNFSDVSGVDKYVMPAEEYAAKTDSVLAWKKAQQLGRFDPHAPQHIRARIAAFAADAVSRGIAVGCRCRVAGDDTRRGVVRYVGEVPEIGGKDKDNSANIAVAGTWVGVELDEPIGGKNDGSIGGTRYWGEAPAPGQEPTLKRGVFVRPDRVDVGDFPALNELEDMEEI
ncbi:cell polarity protein [Grosmannia clavigera kw1407]|uniref:Cell polarity protein n=1 Tax=Grosmannia clavigera (strain kw1407 / UAMH 11150) TaxID=655863 RepID=F0XTQ1_GROCL|nr:cell polarity protein [Grosmannia clavigera kw1407]EFW98709.1 cell polarity protein [Grosmannia clavigera kw1407]